MCLIYLFYYTNWISFSWIVFPCLITFDSTVFIITASVCTVWFTATIPVLLAVHHHCSNSLYNFSYKSLVNSYRFCVSRNKEPVDRSKEIKVWCIFHSMAIPAVWPRGASPGGGRARRALLGCKTPRHFSPWPNLRNQDITSLALLSVYDILSLSWKICFLN